MKKSIIIVLLFLILLPIIVNAETCDINKITISSISMEEKSDDVTEIDEASIDGKKINLNLSMVNVGDNITYKIVVKNGSDENYELDKNSFNIDSEYIDYVLDSEDDSNIVKANTSKTFYLKVNYVNEVPESEFESGLYNDNKTMSLNLATGQNETVQDIINNPYTGVRLYLLIAVILLVGSILIIFFKKKKYVKYMILILGISIIIPMSVKALCKCEIIVESKVKIESQYDYWCWLFYNSYVDVKIHKFKKGMTWEEYVASDDINLGVTSNPNVNIMFKREEGGRFDIGFGDDYKYNTAGAMVDENGNDFIIRTYDNDNGRSYKIPNPALKIRSMDELCYGYIPD